MLHFKCVACRLRLATSGAPEDRVDEMCPRCGSLLEPVGELTEIVGFQAIGTGEAPTNGHRRLATAVREVRDLQEAAAARTGPNAWRWLDADGNFSPATVAAALAAHGGRPTP